MRSPGKRSVVRTAILMALALTTLPRCSPAHAGHRAAETARPARRDTSSPVLPRQAARLTTFTSTRLGISFVYQPGPFAGGERVSAKAVGNRVYVYAGMPYREGQWVEVRTKRAGQRLQDAIRAQLLRGYAPANCAVRAGYARYRRPTYTVMEILPAHVGPGGNFGSTCPQAYTSSNGISYFLADSLHPTTYLFFSIGQYSISATSGRSWQDTIRFLP